LDINTLPVSNSAFLSIGVFEVSPNDDLVAYSIDLSGDEHFDVYIKNLTSQKTLFQEKPIATNTYYSLRWIGNDNVYFNVLDDIKIPRYVRKFCVSCSDVDSPSRASTLLYEEKEDKMTVEVDTTGDEQYLLVKVRSYILVAARVKRLQECLISRSLAN
jgi:oligopeptidase B